MALTEKIRRGLAAKCEVEGEDYCFMQYSSFPEIKDKKFRIPLGVSIAKTNDSSIKGKKSVEDYFKSFELLKNIGDYITINISCPNSGDGRSFEDPFLLESLLKKIEKAKRLIKPILLAK